MSVELQKPAGGVESAHDSMEEFRATQDEFTEFFGDVFDQLQCLSLELFARHKCLEAGTGQKLESEQTFAAVRDDFHRLIEELQQLHGRLQAAEQETQQSWAQIRAGYQQFQGDQAELREIREACRQLCAEFSAIKEDVQRERQDLHELYANVEGQLSRLAGLATELAEARTQPAPDPQIADILEHARQQQADWQQQRAALESELDAMRRRAAEQAESLGEQKRLAGQQQAELSGELKRMRSLLEALAGQVRGTPAATGENGKPQPNESSVLNSVLAQFEMLQRDITSRRSKRNNEPDLST